MDDHVSTGNLIFWLFRFGKVDRCGPIEENKNSNFT